jgi:phosphinothricin acetyltransferase
MIPVTLRPALLDDLPRLTEIHNYYVVSTPVTFDLKPFTPKQRLPWFNEHSGAGRHRMVVAVEPEGRVVGCAATGRFRAKEAYETTVEASIYCDQAVIGRGIGSELYRTLFDSLQDQDINRIVAGITQPNAASVALHERFGFHHVGTFTGNGRKFDRYWDVAWFERPLRL